MSTRSRRKTAGTDPVPVNPNVQSVAAAKKTRAKAPVTKKTKVVVTPAKRRAPLKKQTTKAPQVSVAVESGTESDDSSLLEDSELSAMVAGHTVHSPSEIDKLKQRLAELEANQESRNPLKRNRARAVPEPYQEPSPPDRRGNPAEGRSLGNFNGKTDLDTFLVRFETCSKHFGWSRSEKVFHLINSLTESAEPIVKEGGPTGTLEQIIELLQSRFGNRLRLEKFHADLRNRRRDRNEPLQDLYLDLCRLRALATGESADEKFPEKYYRNIFVDALNDREFRRAVLVQNPGTMEEAYRVATQLEAIDSYDTPVAEASRTKPRVRQIDFMNENLSEPRPSRGPDENMARRIEELENEVQNLRAGAQRQASYFPNVQAPRQVRQSMQGPRPMATGGPASSTHEFHAQGSSSVRGARPGHVNCYNCGEPGHISRDCRKPKFSGHGPRGPRPDNYVNNKPRTGEMKGLTSPSKIRREAYLEVRLGKRNILALLNSGCEQSVIGRSLIKSVPLEPTQEKLSTADGTDLPLLGETVVNFSVSGFNTGCRVVVSEAITELILGIEWLQRNQCVWDFGSNSFTIHGHYGRLKCQRTKRSLRRILVSDEIVIPEFHTTNVPVLVTRSSLGRENPEWGFTQKIKDADLVIASAVYADNDVQSVCQILNISDQPRRLKPGVELGWAEPVEIVSTEGTGVSTQQELENEIIPLDLTQHRVRMIQEPDLNEFDQGELGPTVPVEPEKLNTDFIQDMLDKIDLELSEEQENQVKQILNENREVFSTSEFDLGRTNLVKHIIHTGINRLFKQQLRRHPMAYLPVIDEYVDKMLENEICEPSFSPWASNVVLVKKSDGSLRFCIDYRQLNNLTVKDSYPLPRIDTCFDALGEAKYFSTLDLRQGYWQVENDPETADKTTFITRKGAFKFKVLPFGLSNASAVFQRLMNMVMQGLTWEACLVFLDDIIVISSTFEQHLERLSALFDRLKSANLKLKPSKCKLFQLKVKFFGSVVSAEGIEPDPDKLTAISEWPVPQNLTEVRAFIGLASYYRRHVEGFSKIAKPLSDLTRKSQPFVWGPEQQTAFETLKYCLTHYPILAPPLPEGRYIIDTDASDFAMGAVLQQEQNGVVRVIAYASRTFDAAHRAYCTTRKELAAVIYALKEFRHYVMGGVLFLLRTYHGAQTSLFKTPEPIQQQARYLNFLAEYNFEIQHRAGYQHGNSDGLSRRPCGSKKCSRPDCETDYGQAKETKRVRNRSRNMVPLRSGNPYLKNDDKNRPEIEPQPTVEKSKQNETNSSSDKTKQKMLSIAWNETRQAQEADATLQKLFMLLRDPEPPNEINEFGMGLVNLWNQRESLEIINGVIHRNYETAEGLVLYKQILVPAPLRAKFLYWVHGDPTSGHFGVKKTTDKLQRYAYWSGWRKDVELFVRRCDTCCRYRKGPTKPQGAMKNGVGLAPFQKFHIDLTGPHRRSSGGHVYLLTGICCFTKYLIVVPLRDKSALTVVNALLEHVYLIYGAVELQVHDNGSEFVNSILGHLSKMMGIQDLRSTPYRPVANAAIERTHRTINAIFAKTIKENQRDWHEQAKYVCFAYNTAKHTSTTFSPFFLVFLREPRVGIDLFLDRTEPGYQDTDEYAEKVQERMQKAYKIVSEQLKVTFDRAKQRYDQRVHAVHFPLNSYVWFFCPRLTAGRGRKFRKLTDGPYRIVRVLNDVNYVIQKVPGGRLRICHVDRLLRYEGEVPPVWIKQDQDNDRNRRVNYIHMINTQKQYQRIWLRSNSDLASNAPSKKRSVSRINVICRSGQIKSKQILPTDDATLGHRLGANSVGWPNSSLQQPNQAKTENKPMIASTGSADPCATAGRGKSIKGSNLNNKFISKFVSTKVVSEPKCQERNLKNFLRVQMTRSLAIHRKK